jgi:hypothetical protein
MTKPVTEAVSDPIHFDRVVADPSRSAIAARYERADAMERRSPQIGNCLFDHRVGSRVEAAPSARCSCSRLRSYQNLFFRGKMIPLAVAGVNAWIFHFAHRFGRLAVSAPTGNPRIDGGRIIPCRVDGHRDGRTIAHNWLGRDRQPQAATASFLTTASRCHRKY